MSVAARILCSGVLLLWLWLAAGSACLNALGPSQFATLTLDPSDSEVSLSTGAEVMCDPKGDLPLAAAQSGEYSPLTNQHDTSDRCRGYWLRINLRAVSLPPSGWVLQLARGWAHADLYFEHDGQVSQLKTGTAVPPPKRALASSYLLLPLPLEADRTSTFYLHLTGDTNRYGDARELGGIIQRMDASEAARRDVLFGQGIYTGIILGLVLYNLILYGAIAERAYLYYSLYVVTFGSVWIARTGFFFQFLWPHYPVIESDSPFYLAALSIIFGSLF